MILNGRGVYLSNPVSATSLVLHSMAWNCWDWMLSLKCSTQVQYSISPEVFVVPSTQNALSFLRTWKTPIYPFTFQVCFFPEVFFHPKIQTSSPALPLSEWVNHCWATFQPGKCFYQYPCTDLFTWLSTSEELGSCLLHSYLWLQHLTQFLIYNGPAIHFLTKLIPIKTSILFEKLDLQIRETEWKNTFCSTKRFPSFLPPPSLFYFLIAQKYSISQFTLKSVCLIWTLVGLLPSLVSLRKLLKLSNLSFLPV